MTRPYIILFQRTISKVDVERREGADADVELQVELPVAHLKLPERERAAVEVEHERREEGRHPCARLVIIIAARRRCLLGSPGLADDARRCR